VAASGTACYILLACWVSLTFDLLLSVSVDRVREVVLKLRVCESMFCLVCRMYSECIAVALKSPVAPCALQIYTLSLRVCVSRRIDLILCR